MKTVKEIYHEGLEPNKPFDPPEVIGCTAEELIEWTEEVVADLIQEVLSEKRAFNQEDLTFLLAMGLVTGVKFQKAKEE